MARKAHAGTVNIFHKLWSRLTGETKRAAVIRDLRERLELMKHQRDSLLDMTWLDLPGEPSESTAEWRKAFSEGWERKDRCDMLAASLAEARKTVGFFASVIKSGEAWSPSCEKALREAMGQRPAVDPRDKVPETGRFYG